jgi:hypothetical protein
MFIVTTLTAEITTVQIDRGIIVYENPIVFHLCATLVASALAIMPEPLLAAVAVLLAALGIVGFVYSALTLWRTFETSEFYEPTVWDKLFYGALPCLLYVLMSAGGVAALLGARFAAETIGGASLLLLLVAIRNAWDVATFAVRIARSHDKEPN